MMLRKSILMVVLVGMLAGCNDRFSSGDRVLVSKCAYDAGITGPHRYDVVVFKYPGTDDKPREGPMDKHVPKNYIKRLLGLPGELLAIFFGRLYHRVPAPDKPFYDDLQDGKVDARELRKPPFVHLNEDRLSLENGEFTILRKPPHVMMALRRIVYDNDYQPKDVKKQNDPKLDRWNPSAGSAWKSDKATGFITESKAADKVDWLRYQNLIRPDLLHGGAKFDKMLILDNLDYNEDGPHREIFSSAHWVGDLMIECNLDVKEAKGEFWLELNRSVDHFRACWDLASGECTLYREGPDKKLEKLATQPTKLKGPGNYLVRFANFDARLTVWVDRELPFGDGVEYDPPDVRGPKDKDLPLEALEARRGPTENDLDPASLGVKNATVAVTHLRIWRDTYYRTQVGNGNDTDYDFNMTRADWSSPASFGQLRRQRSTTMYVQPGHYLCLGDNSQSSSDSRAWGLVPERLMLGRALAVYFPLERIGPIR